MERSFRFEEFIFYSLLVLIGLSAIPYGTVELWTRSFFLSGVFLLAVARAAAAVFKGDFRLGERALLIPPLALGVLGAAQIALAENSFTAGVFGSLDPFATKNFLIALVGLLVTAEMLFFYTTTRKRLNALLILVIATALASALFGLGRVWWFDQSESFAFLPFDDGEGFAQFINRNHFMYLAEMASGLLCGLLFYRRGGEKFKFVIWAATATLILAGINANSRGGLISLAVIVLTAVFTYLAFGKKRRVENQRFSNGGRRRRNRRAARQILLAAGVTAAVCGVIILTLAFVGGETTVSRFEKIEGEIVPTEEPSTNRLAIWSATLGLIESRPLFGSGFGAFPAAITRFDAETGGRVKLEQAHNDYLELAAGGGAAAILILLCWLVIFVRRAAQTITRGGDWRRAAASGAVFGALGVAAHSLVDFGLHALCNSLILIVLIVLAAARIETSETEWRNL